ncbi:MAG: GTPase Era [Deltaproteobacteria bacterium]|nr:GTPase Era [Deltaproteobacteria bacterium]
MARAGFCAIIGRPNVGKSTLLNRVLGQKLAAVTPKPQTTRNRILGVKNLAGVQVVFLDTPGVHRGKSELNRYMVEEAFRAMVEVDVILLMVEPPRIPAASVEGRPFDPGPGNELILERLRAAGKPAILALNKVDLLRQKHVLLPLIDGWRKAYDFAAIVPMSATGGLGVDEAVAAVARLLPEGPPLFPEEMLTDRAERFLAAELVREQLFFLLKEEVPYATAVSVEGWHERQLQQGEGVDSDAGRSAGPTVASGSPGSPVSILIEALIHVERESQKGIVIGKRGAMIKEIGTRARAEIAKLLGCPVHLKLFVKVDPEWSRSTAALKRLGYE